HPLLLSRHREHGGASGAAGDRRAARAETRRFRPGRAARPRVSRAQPARRGAHAGDRRATTLRIGGIADNAGRAPSRGGTDPAAGYTGTRGMAAMGGLSQQHADVGVPPVVLSRRTGCDGTHAGSPRGLAAEDRGRLGPARHTAGATRPVPAWHGVLRRRPAADHADALVAQHAAAGHRMARAAAAGRPGARPAELEASVRDRGPARMMRYARPWAARA